MQLLACWVLLLQCSISDVFPLLSKHPNGKMLVLNTKPRPEIQNISVVIMTRRQMLHIEIVAP